MSSAQPTGEELRKQKRRELDARRSKSRIRIGTHLESWCEVKERLGFGLHSDFAHFLLQSYANKACLSCTARISQAENSNVFFTSKDSLCHLVVWLHNHSRECQFLPKLRSVSKNCPAESQPASPLTESANELQWPTSEDQNTSKSSTRISAFNLPTESLTKDGKKTKSVGWLQPVDPSYTSNSLMFWECLGGHTFLWSTSTKREERNEEKEDGSDAGRSFKPAAHAKEDSSRICRPCENVKGSNSTAGFNKSRPQRSSAAGLRRRKRMSLLSYPQKEDTRVSKIQNMKQPIEPTIEVVDEGKNLSSGRMAVEEASRDYSESSGEVPENTLVTGHRLETTNFLPESRTEDDWAKNTEVVNDPVEDEDSLASVEEEPENPDGGFFLGKMADVVAVDDTKMEQDTPVLERAGNTQEEPFQEAAAGELRLPDSDTRQPLHTSASEPEPGQESLKSRKRGNKPDDDLVQIGPRRIRKAAPKEILLCEFDSCGKLFSTRQYLNHHMKYQHFQQKTFTCSHPSCGKSFNFKKHLKEHEKLHSDKRDYICEFCARAFRTSSNLIIHRRIHTGEKPLQCEVCGFTCRQKASLNWHMRKHDAEAGYQFACELCGKKFEKRDNVAAHKSKSHPEPSCSLPGETTTSAHQDNMEEAVQEPLG
ncbi:zinc finger protein 692 [Polypterus senegalus]|uniref:zinc finger protein 692 n=1 Tax=Polypterus senegalus TaxID=55291 RepID=UPI001964451A|nr:zinc finger protein 692 [Polypterus senegalus]